MAAATAPAVPFTFVNGRRIEPIRNPKLTKEDGTPKSRFQTATEFAESAYGAFRILQLLEKIAKVAIHALKTMGNGMVAAVVYLEKIASGLARAWTLLVIPRLFDVTGKAVKAVREWVNPPVVAPVDANRDNVQKMHDVLEAGAAWQYAGSFFIGSTALKNAADATSLASDVMDLQMTAQDWIVTRGQLDRIDREEPANTDSHNQFAYTLRFNLIKLVKAVAAVVGGVLGLLALVLGTSLVSPGFLLLCGTVSATAAVTAHFYKERSDYPIVDHFKSVRAPESLVFRAAAAAGG
jgi:hypothetical protein